MRINKSAALAGVAALALALSACGGGATTSPSAPAGSESAAPGGDKLSVANVVNGSLGDQGFFDDAERHCRDPDAFGREVGPRTVAACVPGLVALGLAQ